MKKILVDTNIVIDLLSKREAFYQEAQELFTLADQKKVLLYVSSLTIANTHYLLSSSYKIADARKILIKFKILELALVSDFNDFEDAIQYHTALENNIDVILTRNKKDFKNSILPVLNAKEFLIK